jgi:hypothetical protein
MCQAMKGHGRTLCVRTYVRTATARQSTCGEAQLDPWAEPPWARESSPWLGEPRGARGGPPGFCTMLEGSLCSSGGGGSRWMLPLTVASGLRDSSGNATHGAFRSQRRRILLTRRSRSPCVPRRPEQRGAPVSQWNDRLAASGFRPNDCSDSCASGFWHGFRWGGGFIIRRRVC